jgi:hypothetical protein
MEDLRQVVAGLAFPTAPTAGRCLVIAFRDDEELSVLGTTRTQRALTMQARAPLWQPLIVMSASSNLDLRDVTHELTHLVSYAVVHDQPRWFAEGIASFFENVRLDPDSAVVEVGVAPEYHGRPARMWHLVPVSTLFGWQTLPSASNEGGLYTTAWALFTFLFNERPAKLVRYMELLGQAGDPANGPPSQQFERAWAEAFPSLPNAVLDGELRRWLQTGSHRVLRFNVKVSGGPVAERTLGDADAYAVRGLLLREPGQEVQARAAVAAALAAEPTNVLAQLLTLQGGGARITPGLGRAIVAAHGDDWRAWWLASIALTAAHLDGAEVKAAAMKACELLG